RFVIRRYSPAITIGGGLVIDPRLGKLARSTRREILSALGSPLLGERIEQLARLGGLDGISLAEIESRSGLTGAALRQHVDAQPIPSLVSISPGRWLHQAQLQRLRETSMVLLAGYFREHRMTLGVPRSELVQKLFPGGTDPAVIELCLADLARERILILEGERIDVPGRSKLLGGTEGELARLIESRFRDAGLHTPPVSELIQTIPQKPKVIEGVIGFLVKSGVLVRLAENIYLHRDVAEESASRLREHRGETIDVAWFKEFFGLTRKVAIPLLEHFDRVGVTRRLGDQRKVL
ncbi:MAG TPA: SelB C-terminal domain-containing protein, partial [Thermoanaerobaculia bacterium]|nr:SelB C-terminal domain-containing protein [Thermoanaerobaculia bacterium]